MHSDNQEGMARFQMVPLRVKEKMLNQAYAISKSEFFNLKIGNVMFQTLRLTNICLKGAAKKLACCYLYLQNIEYLQKTVARILRINKRDNISFENNKNMYKFLLCDDKNILCVHQICETCSFFPNLAELKEHFPN